MAELFVYGSLQLPAVLEVVLGYVPPMEMAQAAGWKVCQLQGAAYPGLVADPAETAVGILLSNLDEAAIAALDDFEGVQYQRELIEIRTVEDEICAAHTYILADDSALSAIWTKNHLTGQALEDFLQRCIKWRSAYYA